VRDVAPGDGLGGGSGWVAVAPIDGADQRGCNGVNFIVAVAVLAEIWVF
jgi:hypothetical protein